MHMYLMNELYNHMTNVLMKVINQRLHKYVAKDHHHSIHESTLRAFSGTIGGNIQHVIDVNA